MSRVRGHCRPWMASAVLLVAGLWGSQAKADPILNGGFEDPTPFHFWGTVGDTQIQGSLMGVSPTEGLSHALLATYTDGSINPVVVPGAGVAEGTLESGLGLSYGSLSTFSGSTILAGSGISQTVHLVAGEKLSFKWDFLTNQTYNDGTNMSIAPSATNNDFSFFNLVNEAPGGSSQIFKLADTFYGYSNDPSSAAGFDSGLVLTDPSNPFISETKYQSFSITVSVTGDYLVGAGVAHVTAGGAPDNGVNSGLLVDDFKVAAVPEPASFLGLGLLGMGVVLRRRRK